MGIFLTSNWSEWAQSIVAGDISGLKVLSYIRKQAEKDMESKAIVSTSSWPLNQLLFQGSHPVWVPNVASLSGLGLQICKPSNSFLPKLLLVMEFHHKNNSPSKTNAKIWKEQSVKKKKNTPDICGEKVQNICIMGKYSAKEMNGFSISEYMNRPGDCFGKWNKPALGGKWSVILLLHGTFKELISWMLRKVTYLEYGAGWGMKGTRKVLPSGWKLQLGE